MSLFDEEEDDEPTHSESIFPTRLPAIFIHAEKHDNEVDPHLVPQLDIDDYINDVY